MTPEARSIGAEARRNVLQQLATAHDLWSNEEQLAAADGRVVEAEGAHRMALWVLRAYRAEMADPPIERSAT